MHGGGSQPVPPVQARERDTVLLPWGQTSWGPQDPSAVLGGGCWVPNPRNYSRALRAVLVALEVAGQRVGKDDETHGNGTQRGLRSVPRSPLMRLVHARGREQKTRGALIKPRASADWRRRS